MATTSQDLRAEPLSDSDRKLIEKLFSNPLVIPIEFKQWLVAWLEANPPQLPVMQLSGFDNAVSTPIADTAAKIFVPQMAVNETEVHFSTTSFAPISGGPSLTGLDDGVYLIDFGAAVNATGGDAVEMAVSINGGGASPSAESQAQDTHISIARAVSGTLSAGVGANTIEAVYTTQLGHDCDQRRGWLRALKISN